MNRVHAGQIAAISCIVILLLQAHPEFLRDTPGLVISKHLDKMGLRTSPMAEVVFDNCRVPVANRLGREGRGVPIF